MDISVPSETTDLLLKALEQHAQVMGLSVSRGASIKPPGDVITVHVLNRGADDVLRLISQTTSEYSIVTAETSSIIDSHLDPLVERDVDEALWEELETGLRHQGRITPNFLALMALGGVLGCLGLTTEGAPQATALIAASIISPGFEPIAKVALGLTLRRWNVVQRGLLSTLAGYSVFILTAALTFLLLRWTGGERSLHQFTENTELTRLAHPGVRELLFSSVGALSGAVIMAAFRRSVIAGALIALVIIPAAAACGMGLAAGRLDLAWQGLERALLDVVLILFWGVLVFTIKQVTVHRRAPLV